MALAPTRRGNASSPTANKEATIAQLLERHKSDIALALPKHVTPDRLLRIAISEVRRNPKLREASAASLLSSIFICAQLGLEPGGPLGQAYLIPYKGECQFQIGYKGMIELARRSGQIQTISARIVCENDHFEYDYGTDESISHKPAVKNRGKLTFAYAVAKLKDGGIQFEVMSRDELEEVRNNSQGYRSAINYKNDNPWISSFEEMCRKTVIRRLFKYLPVSIEVMEAVRVDDITDRGERPTSDIDHLLATAQDVPALPAEVVTASAPVPTLTEAQQSQILGSAKNILNQVGALAFERNLLIGYEVQSLSQIPADRHSEIMAELGKRRLQDQWNRGVGVTGDQLVSDEEIAFLEQSTTEAKETLPQSQDGHDEKPEHAPEPVQAEPTRQPAPVRRANQQELMG